MLNDWLSNPKLSLELRVKIQNVIEKANNIDNDDFLKNFNAVTVKPIVDKCQEYIQNMERYGTEFEELETDIWFCARKLHITSKKFVISESSVAELKVEIAKLENNDCLFYSWSGMDGRNSSRGTYL